METEKIIFKHKEYVGHSYCYLEVSQNELIEIGIVPVIFGFRIVASFKNENIYQLNWCAGENAFCVSWLFSALKKILQEREESRLSFYGIPKTSEIKPFFNDMNFLIYIMNHAGYFNTQWIPNLTELRQKYFDYAFSDGI